MLLVYKGLLLIGKLKLSFLILKAIGFAKKSIRYFFSPVYKHLKDIFEYTKIEKGTGLKKTSNMRKQHFFKTKLFKE